MREGGGAVSRRRSLRRGHQSAPASEASPTSSAASRSSTSSSSPLPPLSSSASMSTRTPCVRRMDGSAAAPAGWGAAAPTGAAPSRPSHAARKARWTCSKKRSARSSLKDGQEGSREEDDLAESRAER